MLLGLGVWGSARVDLAVCRALCLFACFCLFVCLFRSYPGIPWIRASSSGRWSRSPPHIWRANSWSRRDEGRCACRSIVLPYLPLVLMFHIHRSPLLYQSTFFPTLSHFTFHDSWYLPSPDLCITPLYSFLRVWVKMSASASSSTTLCCWNWPGRTSCSTTRSELPPRRPSPTVSGCHPVGRAKQSKGTGAEALFRSLPPARALPQQSPPFSAKVVFVCFGSKRSIIVSIPLPPYHRTPALKGVPCNVALFYENKMCSCLFYCDLATNAARNLCPFFFTVFLLYLLVRFVKAKLPWLIAAWPPRKNTTKSHTTAANLELGYFIYTR